MIQRRFISDNNAVAGVIEALLLVALVAVILSMIQLTYIPQIMEDKEANHMDQVSNQFSNLKSVIEIQSTMGIINEGSPSPKNAPYTSISSPLTLGSEELPYFISAGSYGQVQLIDDDEARGYNYRIDPDENYKTSTAMAADFLNGIPLTSIKYEASNFYFVPQTYVLEGSGIILKQSNGEVMSVSPAMNVINNTNNIEIYWNIPLFVGVPGKNLTGGYKECYIRTNYTTYHEYGGATGVGTSYIRIFTDYPDAWNQSLIKDDTGVLWEYYNNGYVNVQIDDTTTPDRVVITPGTKTINLKLTIAEIGVQVGAGTVLPN